MVTLCADEGKILHSVGSNDYPKIKRVNVMANDIELYEEVDKTAVPPYTRAEYEAKVSELIRSRYTLDAELAILRQRESKPQEYASYNAFAEQCKADAKELLSQPKDEAPAAEDGEDAAKEEGEVIKVYPTPDTDEENGSDNSN